MGVGITMENGKSGKLRRVLLIVCALMLVAWGVLIAHVIRVSKEQLEENGKFYMDDPQNMEIIKEQRGAE